MKIFLKIPESHCELNDTSKVPKEAYCYCCGPEEGTMIACDNPDCRIEWFHTTYLKLKFPQRKV